MSLSWGASTDASGVAGYRIYRNGTQVGQTSATNYTDGGLTDGTSYSYYVRAYDAAGNISAASNTVSVTPVAPATTTGTATLSSADPSGVPMPVGDVPGWHQTFADDFGTGTVPMGSFSGCTGGVTLSLNTCSGLAGYPSTYQKWGAYPDGWTDHQFATYYPSAVMSINNGIMDYYLHTQTVGSTSLHMTAAAVPKVPGGVNGGGLLYGRYVFRARFDNLPGYHVAFLLWPDSGNQPRDGEIDFPDDRLDQSTSIDAFVHWPGTTTGQFDYFGTPGNISQWHTYEIRWLPTALSFYVDGKLIGTETSHIPSTPMHWVLQTDTWTSGEPAPSNSTGGHVQIDWATAYTPAG